MVLVVMVEEMENGDEGWESINEPEEQPLLVISFQNSLAIAIAYNIPAL